jgi:hypothetical protein
MTAPAVVVLGNHCDRTCRQLVGAAADAAERHRAELVVFSGWSPDGGPSEAARMHAFWEEHTGTGVHLHLSAGAHLCRSVEVALEETASTTAENAARTLRILLERDVTESVVVCTPAHMPRARLIFRHVYGRHGVSARFRLARVAPTPGALVWELGALTVLARQLRAARTELERS